MKQLIDQRLGALAKQPFRAKFHLSPKDLATVRGKGLVTMASHAADLINKRLAPAFPANDGKQTPWRGYPVFVAQHATATCCRSCLEKWHRLPRGRELTAEERDYVVAVIATWIQREIGRSDDQTKTHC